MICRYSHTDLETGEEIEAMQVFGSDLTAENIPVNLLAYVNKECKFNTSKCGTVIGVELIDNGEDYLIIYVPSENNTYFEPYTEDFDRALNPDFQTDSNSKLNKVLSLVKKVCQKVLKHS